MKLSCPGSKEIKSPVAEEIGCIFCGFVNEIWSDEAEITCKKCSKMVSRDIGASCIIWCQAAKECVGEEKYNRIMKDINNKQ